MRFTIFASIALCFFNISCKKSSSSKAYYRQAIGDREQGPLENAIEIDEYLALYEHLSSKFLHCRDYKTKGDCKEELDYEMDLSESEKDRLWLYNLQKAQSITLDENTPQNIRLAAQVGKIDRDLKEAERIAGPLVKREKDSYFSVLIGPDHTQRQIDYLKSLKYSKFLKNSSNRDMEIDKQIALLGLMDPNVTKMEGKDENSKISDQSLTTAGEINSAIAINLAYLNRKRLKNSNSAFFKDTSEYFQAYIVQYAQMIKEERQEGRSTDEASGYVLETAKHPKVFADHIVSSISQLDLNEEDAKLSHIDVNEALKKILLTEPSSQPEEGLQLRNTVTKVRDIWRSAYKVYETFFDKGIIGGGMFIFYVGMMAFDNADAPPRTLYEKYILTTQSVYAFTSGLELYKLFSTVLPTKVTSYVLNAINTSTLGVNVNANLNTMAKYAIENVKNTLSKVAAGLTNFQAATLSQKITFALNTMQVINAVAYFLGGLYTAYSSYNHFKAGEVVQAGLDIGTSALYFFAAAAQVAGVLFAIPGAQPLAIIFATVGFVLQIVKWFLPKTPHPLVVFLDEKVHPDKSYIDMENCSGSSRDYYDCGNVVAALSKKVGRNLVKTPVGFGGTGGRDFDDHRDFNDPERVDEYTKIRRLAVWTCRGQSKMGFEVFYNRGNTEYERVVHGCDFGLKDQTMSILNIEKDEELSSVKIHKIKYGRNERISGFEFCKSKNNNEDESCIKTRSLGRSGKSIKFTNEAIYSFFGERESTKGRIVGFFGKSGASIDRLGVYVAVDRPKTNRFVNKTTTSNQILATVNAPNVQCIAQFANPIRFFGKPTECSFNSQGNLWSVTLKPDHSVNLRAQGTDKCLSVVNEDVTPRAKLNLSVCDGARKDQNLQMYETTGGFKLKFNHSELCVSVGAGTTALQVHCGSKEATVFTLKSRD